MHKEDIKAALRKAHGSLLAFEIAKGLPTNSVKDVLRGRANGATEKAIAETLKLPLEQVFPHRNRAPKVAESSTKADGSGKSRSNHRLSSAA